MFSAILGGVSVLGGLYSSYQQDKAQASGEAYQAKHLDLAERNLQFNQEQMARSQFEYNQFQNLYGDIEKNLANYYKNLSPDTYTTQANSAIAQQFEQASVNMRESMAARGIEGSGVEAGAMANMYGEKALAESQVEAGADQWVANQQQQFYQNQAAPQQQYARNNMNTATNNYNNSMGNMSNAFGNQANTQFNLAGQYGQSAAQGIGGGMQAIGNSFGTPKPNMNNSANYNMSPSQAREFNSYE